MPTADYIASMRIGFYGPKVLALRADDTFSWVLIGLTNKNMSEPK